jgi:thiol:disulfide interchange protein
MLFALSLLIPLLVLAFWLFWRLSPQGPDPRRVRLFNLVASAVVLLIGVAVAVGVRASMAASSDHAAWPVVAAFYALAAIPLCLALAAGLRRLAFGARTPAKPLEITRDLSKTRF